MELFSPLDQDGLIGRLLGQGVLEEILQLLHPFPLPDELDLLEVVESPVDLFNSWMPPR